LDKAIESRESYSAQSERLRALEVELTQLKNWDSEKASYELKKIGLGAVAYMLKPEKRSTEPPHWLCPTCFAKGQKSFLNFTGTTVGRRNIFKCTGCGSQPAADGAPAWED
jgi:hypothetical protein